MDDVLLVGYGAVGVIYAYIIQHSGHARVTVVARSNYEAAKNGQIVINSDTLGKIIDFKPYRVVASVDEAADRPYKYVVVCTKAMPDVLPTSKLLAPLLAPSYTHPQPTYVLIQNGLGVEKDLYAKLLECEPSVAPQIITCAVFIVTQMNGNVVNNLNVVPRLEIGIYAPAGGADPTSTHTASNMTEFITMLEAGGSAAVVVPNVQAAKFNKNLLNVVIGIASGLTRVPVPFYLVTPEAWAKSYPFLLAIGTEVISVGRALGFSEKDLPSSKAQDTLDFLRSLNKDPNANIKPSLLMDIEAGRSFELEVILGDIVRAGQSLGVPIPLLGASYTMLSITQAYILRAPAPPPSVTPSNPKAD
ncbi:hypothetical protein FRB93_012334 [Tulasnella sp. JGI-2019a]|nr:hypothetical protein FRB93_012334 [Tulasnella sp. JGI-2019a]